MLKSDVIFGADGGARHTIVSDDGDHGPWPAALIAATRNSYSWFSIKPSTLQNRIDFHLKSAQKSIWVSLHKIIHKQTHLQFKSDMVENVAFVHLSSEIRRFSTT